jgi:hypothetical protein
MLYLMVRFASKPLIVIACFEGMSFNDVASAAFQGARIEQSSHMPNGVTENAQYYRPSHDTFFFAGLPFLQRRLMNYSSMSLNEPVFLR